MTFQDSARGVRPTIVGGTSNQTGLFLNMRLGSRMIAAFVFVSLLVVGVGGVSMHFLGSLRGQLTQVAERVTPMDDAADNALGGLSEARSAMFDAYAATTPYAIPEISSRFHDATDEIDRRLQDLDSLITDSATREKLRRGHEVFAEFSKVGAEAIQNAQQALELERTAARTDERFDKFAFHLALQIQRLCEDHQKVMVSMLSDNLENEASSSLVSVVNRHYPVLQRNQRILIGAANARSIMMEFLAEDHPEHGGKWISEFAALREQMLKDVGETAEVCPIESHRGTAEDLHKQISEWLGMPTSEGGIFEVHENMLAMREQLETSSQTLGQLAGEFDDCLEAIDNRAEALSSAASDGTWSVFRAARVGVIAAMWVAPVIGIALGLLLTRSVTRPLKRCVQHAEAIAKGDLTGRIINADSSVHEIAQLGRALDDMTHGLRKMMNRIADTAGTLRGAATELATASTQMAGSAEEMSAQSTGVAGASEQLSANTQAVATSGEELTANVKTVAASVEEMSASIAEVSRNAEQAAQVSDEAAHLAETSNCTIGQLGASANEIGRVIQVIQDIAEQTNLLALNATIEAARAGEAGKGFAVVANEVKELAKQTADATEDIRRRIEGIQQSTGHSVSAIGEIGEVIQSIKGLSRTIASAVEEQSITTREIAESLSQAAVACESVSDVAGQSATASEDISRNIAGMDTVIRQTAQAAVQTDSAGAEMSTLAEQLQIVVGQFQLEAKDDFQVDSTKTKPGGRDRSRAAGQPSAPATQAESKQTA